VPALKRIRAWWGRLPMLFRVWSASANSLIHRAASVLVVAIPLGLRPAEALGLAWRDIDLVERRLVFRHARLSRGRSSDPLAADAWTNACIPLRSDVVLRTVEP
jgi:integrase